MTTTTARLDLRLSARDKSRIARAAALRGMAVATFVRDTVLREQPHRLVDRCRRKILGLARDHMSSSTVLSFGF